MADGIQMANDAVASAKKALSGEAHSSVGSKVMDASYHQVKTVRENAGLAPKPTPTVGDELAAKKSNVDQYVAATK